MAEHLAGAFKLPQWRFVNSGSEATMDAIRVARAFTGRETIVKMFGSYHGHHDYVMVSIGALDYGKIGPRDNYASLPYGGGIPQSLHRHDHPGAVQRHREHDQAHRAPGRGGQSAGLRHHGTRHDEPRRRAARARLPRRRARRSPRSTASCSSSTRSRSASAPPAAARSSAGASCPTWSPSARRSPAALPAAPSAAPRRSWPRSTTAPSSRSAPTRGNPLSMAAARASWEQVMTDDAYAHLNHLNDRIIAKCDAVCAEVRLPRLHRRHLVQGLRQLRPRQDHRLRVVHQGAGRRSRRPGVAVQHQPRPHHRPRPRRGVDALHHAHRRRRRPLRRRVRGPRPRRHRLRRIADGPAAGSGAGP